MSVPWSKQLEGKYEIVEKLGEGGMGTVYKVRHRLLDEIRVVKTMRASLSEDKELQSRFLREAKLASRLRHANIAQLFDFTIAEDGKAFIVMEYIPGIGLDRLLEARGPLDIGVTLELAIQSLAAIGYLHGRKYIHRDVSPDNLMLSRDHDDTPCVKLIDLGIAKVLGEGAGLTVTGMFLGKLRYSSPEQLDGSVTEELDGRSDLYSFGVVLYELLTGRLPFEATSPAAMMAGHLFRPPIPFERSDPSGRVPEALRRAILRVMDKKRDVRFRDAAEFAAELRAIQEHHPMAPGELSQVMRSATLRQGTVGTRGGATSAQVRLDREFGVETTPLPHLEDGATRQLGPAAVAAGLSPGEIAVLVSGARKFYDLGQRRDAERQLDAVLALSPSHTEARELRDLIARERLQDKIKKVLAENDLEAAEALLEEAQENTPVSELESLWAELRTLQRKRAAELFAQAEAALGQERAKEAAELIAQALALGPDAARYQTLIGAVDDALARNSLLEELLPALETTLAGARAEEARWIVDRIVTELGEGALPAEARDRLDRLEVQQKIANLIAQADGALAEDRLEEAFAHFEAAAELAPGDLEIVRRRDEIRRRFERRRDLEAETQHISSLIESGEPEKALSRLDLADAELGYDDVLRELRDRAETLQQLENLRFKIEQELARGNFDSAQAHFEHLSELATRSEIDTLGARIDALRREATLSQIHIALAESRALIASGRWHQVYAHLDRAAELAQTDDEAAEVVAKARTSAEQTERAVVAERRIEALIAKGDPVAARVALEASESVLVPEVGARLAERVTDLARRKRIKEALSEGEQLLVGGDLAEAEAHFATVAELAPEDEHARERLDFIRREQSRLGKIRLQIERVNDAFEAGRLEEIGGYLQAVDSLGGEQETEPLRRQLEDSLQAVAALDQAFASQGLEVVRQALDLLRGQRGGPALAGPYASRFAALCEESFENLIKAAKIALAKEDFATAVSALESLESLPFGERPEVAQLTHQVVSGCQRRQAAIDSICQRIDRLLESDKLTAVGIWVAQLERLTPGDPELVARKAELERRRQTRDDTPAQPIAEKTLDDASVLLTVGKVASTLEAGDTARARELLEQAETSWGKHRAFDAAWDRLGRLEEEQGASPAEPAPNN